MANSHVTRRCSVDGCETINIQARGMCGKHYTRWRVTGSTERNCKTCNAPLGFERKASDYCGDKCKWKDPKYFCSHDGCEGRARRRKLCDFHYERKRQESKTKKCKSSTCKKPAITKGFCWGHYQRLRDGQSVDTPLFDRRKSGSSVHRDEQGRRRCTGCKKFHPVTEFVKGRCADGFSSRCSSCRLDYRLRKYGISSIEYMAMLEEQGGVCAICGDGPGDKMFNVDHDHSCCAGGGSCGRCVRGLLCGQCNFGIGNFRDDVGALASAINYLKSH